MSTRSDGTSTRSRDRRTRRTAASPRTRLVLCLRHTGYEASLEPRKIYVSIADREAGRHGQLRVVDESGEDYLFPASLFVSIRLPAALRRTLLAGL